MAHDFKSCVVFFCLWRTFYGTKMSLPLQTIHSNKNTILTTDFTFLTTRFVFISLVNMLFCAKTNWLESNLMLFSYNLFRGGFSSVTHWINKMNSFLFFSMIFFCNLFDFGIITFRTIFGVNPAIFQLIVERHYFFWTTPNSTLTQTKHKNHSARKIDTCSCRFCFVEKMPLSSFKETF